VALSHLGHLGLLGFDVGDGEENLTLDFLKRFFLYQVLIAPQLGKGKDILVVDSVYFQRYLERDVLILGMRIVSLSSAQSLPKSERARAKCAAERSGRKETYHKKEIAQIRLTGSIWTDEHIQWPNVKFSISEVLEIPNLNIPDHPTAILSQ
jgi:hypothetical protein